jgi:endonuclease/exonuclease/phosphatase family metal-dependent hydrolase
MRLPKGLLAGVLVLSAVGIAGPTPGARASTPSLARIDPGPAAGPHSAYTIAPPAIDARPATRRAAATVSVMSFNVCGGVCHRGEVSRTAAFTVRTAVARKADVVLLQELCHSQYIRIRKLLAARGYSGRFAASTQSGACDDDDRQHGKGFGVAVLVHGRATSPVVRHLPTPAGFEPRLMLGVTAAVGGRPTLVAVVHLAPSPAAGLGAQMGSVADYLNPRAGRPVIVGGDFNALPHYGGLSRLYGRAAGGTGRFIEMDQMRGGTAARSGAPTFDVAGRKIDYIFASAGLFARPRAVALPTAMSDHRVYIGTVRVPNGRHHTA